MKKNPNGNLTPPPNPNRRMLLILLCQSIMYCHYSSAELDRPSSRGMFEFYVNDAAKHSAMMNQHMADRLHFNIEVQMALGVEEVDFIIPRIIDLQKTSTRLKVIKKEEAFQAQA